jgi:hypothetical protein
MKWHRRFRILGLTLALLGGVSCTTTDGALTGVPDAEPIQQPSQLLGDLDLIDDAGEILDGVGGILGGAGDALDDLGGAVTESNPTTGGTGGLVDGVVSPLGWVVRAAGEITDLLTCSEQKYVAVTQTIGPKGGQIRVGEHLLEIPARALSSKVKITAEQMRGSTNSVRFSPEGLTFERPARLTMSYQNCAIVLLPKTIVYTTEKLEVSEVLRSLDLFKKKTVTAPIYHFSRYAVAY